MAQAYSDPERENDPHALPDIEIFYAKAGELGWQQELTEAGWYWWACFPGCMPDSEPMGPFDTEARALADAQDGSW